MTQKRFSELSGLSLKVIRSIETDVSSVGFQYAFKYILTLDPTFLDNLKTIMQVEHPDFLKNKRNKKRQRVYEDN